MIVQVQDLPRAARLCLVVYSVSKMAKGARGSRRAFKDADNEMYLNPLAWANTTVFDYEGLLKTGAFTVYMWTYAEDVQNEEIMNPLGISSWNTWMMSSLYIKLNWYIII